MIETRYIEKKHIEDEVYKLNKEGYTVDSAKEHPYNNKFLILHVRKYFEVYNKQIDTSKNKKTTKERADSTETIEKSHKQGYVLLNI